MTQAKAKFAYPDSLDLEDKLGYGIGALVMHWGSCETLFYGMLEALAGREGTDVGAILWLSHRSNRDRLDLIQRLAKARGLKPALVGEIVDLCARFKSVTRVRNFFCHASYRADPQGNCLGVEGYQLTDEDIPLKLELRPLTKGLLNEIKCAVVDAITLHGDGWTLILKLRHELKSRLPALPPGLDEYLSRKGLPPRP